MTIDDAVNKTVSLSSLAAMVWTQPALKRKSFMPKLSGAIRLACGSKTPSSRPRVCDDNGAIIPPDRRQLEEHVAHVLIPWGNIRSVVYFPTRQGFDTAEDEEASALGRGMYL